MFTECAISLYPEFLSHNFLAVFYFVGHGFEKNGKNYLLAVDAPNVCCRIADCISVEWVLSVFEDSHPALNLILLDVCRKDVKYVCCLFFYFENEYQCLLHGELYLIGWKLSSHVSTRTNRKNKTAN